jgi:hypothetical protein
LDDQALAPKIRLLGVLLDLGINFGFVAEIVRKRRMDIRQIELELGRKLIGREAGEGVIRGQIRDAQRCTSHVRPSASDVRIGDYGFDWKNLDGHSSPPWWQL